MKLSIITINFNNCFGLQKTLNSISVQSFKEFEYLVIDGKSYDGSLEILDSNIELIDCLVSESDSGIFHAMNKGILRAKGEYLFFLNSGDVLYSSYSLEKVIAELSGCDIVYGDVVWRDGLTTCYPYRLNFGFLKNRSLPHQGSFVRKDLFNRVGLFDENLKITGDWKFFLIALCKENASYKKVDQIISIMEPGGVSDTSIGNSGRDVIMEKYSVLSREFNLFLSDYHKFEKTAYYLRPFQLNFWKRYFSKYRRSTAVSKYDW